MLDHLACLNATQAAIRAGYSAKTANRIAAQNLSKLDIQIALTAIRAGYSEKTANEQASRLLANVKVQTLLPSLTHNGVMRRIDAVVCLNPKPHVPASNDDK
ncbi:terminase small subunit [Edwardsiella tarda]|uniref:terminase small subunit n=1 Tax=Edwardsiella tarda TaxID=636 RepID=UPI003A881958